MTTITHTQNAGRIPTTQRADDVVRDGMGCDRHPLGCVRFTTPRVGDGAPLRGCIAFDRVVSIDVEVA